MFNSWHDHGTNKTTHARPMAYRTSVRRDCRRLRLEPLESRWVLAAPTALPDAINVLEGGTSSTLTTGELSLLANDTDPDAGDTLQVNSVPVVAPLHGTLVLNSDGTFDYTHDGTEEFTDSFLYEVLDTGGEASQGLVTIMVTPVNDNVPVAEAGGPYTLFLGDDLNLDASGSTDADLDAMLVYRWDFNLDGVPDFETTDPIASAPAATLIGSGLDGGIHTISLTVDDEILSATDTAELRVFEVLSVTLPTDGVANSLLLRRNGPLLEIIDASSSAVLADTLFDFTTSVNIVGGNDDTTLVMDFSVGPLIPGGGVTFAGGAGNDTLELKDYLATSVIHTFETTTDGTIDIDGTQVRYLNLEFVEDNGIAVDRLFEYSSPISQSLAIDSPSLNTVVATSNVGVQTEFVGPSGTLVFRTGPDDDTISSSLNSLLAGVVTNVIAGEGADRIELRATSTDTDTMIEGNEGNDLFVLGSVTGSLDELFGAITVRGGTHDVAPLIADPITAKERTLGQSLVVGDTLQWVDAGTAGPHTYTVSDTTLDRNDIATVTYETIETLELLAGVGASTITVTTTASQTRTQITTQDAGDTITVQNTGAASITHITTAGGNDTVTVQTTGAGSGLSLNTGNEDDTILFNGNGADSNIVLQAGAGADTIQVRTTSTGSFSDLRGGIGNDRFVLGLAIGSFDNLLGEICIFGENHDGTPLIPDPITAKGRTLGQSLVVGDTLQFNDAGDDGPHTYTLTDTTFIRDGSATVTYETIESLQMVAGFGASTITVTTTAPQTRTRIITQNAADTITLQNTGAASITHVNTFGGNDTVTVQATGAASGLFLSTDNEDDTVHYNGNGTDSNVVVQAGADDDTVLVRATSAGSFSDLRSAIGNDRFVLGSAIGSLNNLFGEICIFGEDHEGAPLISDPITAKGRTLGQALVVGDILQLVDTGAAGSHTYTVSDTTFNRTGMATVTYDTIESLELLAGIGANTITITATAPQTRTRITTQDAADTITVQNTGAGSMTHIATAGGIDNVTVQTTGAASGLSINTGDDDDTVLLNGNGADSNVLLQAGTGADSVQVRAASSGSLSDLLGGAGNDLFVLGNIANSLDNLQGGICIFGDAHEAAPLIPDPITAKGRTLGQALVVGDTLQLVDAGAAGSHTYTVSDTTLLRTGMATVIYDTIESLELLAGIGASIITIDTIASQTRARITTQDAADTIRARDTGAFSITHIATAGGADNVTVQATGAISGLSINTGDDNDTIFLDGNGTDSNVLLQAGTGADTVRVHATSMRSLSELLGNAGNDLFVLENSSSSLDNLQGEICIFGDEHEAAPLIPDPITANGRTLGQTLVVGDTLQLVDAGDAGPHTYTVSDTTFNRTGMATVTYDTIESLELLAGIGASTITVTTTAPQTRTQITTQDAADTITVQNTGDASVTHVTTAGGNDNVTVQTTGAASGLSLNSGANADSITVDGNGVDSNLVLQAGTGDDTIDFESSSSGSVSVLDGGDIELIDGDDTIQIAPNAMRLDQIRGSVFVDGNSHDVTSTHLVRQDRFTIPGSRYTTSSMLVEAPRATEARGDILRIFDRANTSDGTYHIGSAAVRRDTIRVDYESIEQLEVRGGSGDDVFDVLLPTGPTPSMPTVTVMDGGVGHSEVIIDGSSGDDTIFVGSDASPSGMQRTMFEVAGNDVCLHLIGRAGNDHIGNMTAHPALIEGGDGDDILVGGSVTDVLFGGPDVDALFGMAGDDFLFSDLDAQGNFSPVADELLDGGSQITRPPGDTAVQTGRDSVKNIETLSDGGAEKDVITWLSAQLAGNNAAAIAQLVDQALMQLEALGCQADIARSSQARLDDVAAPLSSTTTNSAPISALDVNQDGAVTPLDALLVINALSNAAAGIDPRTDINGDGLISPLDAVLVINQLGSVAAAAQTGSPAAPLSAAASRTISQAHAEDVPAIIAARANFAFDTIENLGITRRTQSLKFGAIVRRQVDGG